MDNLFYDLEQGDSQYRVPQLPSTFLRCYEQQRLLCEDARLGSQVQISLEVTITLGCKKEKSMVHRGPHRSVFPAETLKEMREQSVISWQNAQKVKTCSGQELGMQL